jgi:hypothetical protein
VDTDGVVTVGVWTGGVVTSGVTGVVGTVTGGTVTGGTVTGGTVTVGVPGSGGCWALATGAHIEVQMTTVTPRHQRRDMSSPLLAMAVPGAGVRKRSAYGYC